jgi:predicted metal-dependent peptidase
MSAKVKIRNATKPLFVTEPLLFGILMLHELVENNEISYIRVGRGRIEYNADWVEKTDLRALLYFFTFELIRILLKHPYKRIKPNKEISYMASNITVDEITDLPLNVLRAGDVAGKKKADDRPGKTGYFEYYYAKLIETTGPEGDSLSNPTPASRGLEGADGAGSGGGSGDNDPTAEDRPPDEKASGSGENGDSDEPGESEGGGNPYTDPDMDMMAEAASNWMEDNFWNQKIDEQIEVAERTSGWGSLSGDLREMIRADLTPEVDYRYILKKFKRTILSHKTELTRMRPNRRFEFDQLGKKRVCTTTVAIYVDVSGSIVLRDLKMMLSVCRNMLHMGMRAVDVYFFDTRVHNPDKPFIMKNAIRTVRLCGRSGTDGQVCVDHFDNHKKKYDGMIMLTDGEMSEISVKNRRNIFMLFNTKSMWKNCRWKDRVAYSAYVAGWK